MVFKNVLSTVALLGILWLVYIDLTNIEAEIPAFVYGGLFWVVFQAKVGDVLDAFKTRYNAKR